MVKVNDIIKYTFQSDTSCVEYYMVVNVKDTTYDTMDAMGQVDIDYPIGDFKTAEILQYGTKEWNVAFGIFMKELDDWNNQVTSQLKKAYKFVNKLKRI